MLNKLRTVIYHVEDLQKAKEWYIQLTGVKPYFDEPFYVGFEINGCELGLDPDMDRIVPGNHSVSFWSVNDIQAAVNKAVEIGGIIFSGINSVGEGISVATITDPFGNHIGFIKGA